MPGDAVRATLVAAAEVLRSVGADLVGGHTIRTREPIFGLAVQGSVDPHAIWRKRGARPGDVLVLSKPLGTGLVLNGRDEDWVRAAIAGMSKTNRAAAAALKALHRPPSCVTDVTGFGLLGHSWEIAERSGVRLVLRAAKLPIYDGALEAAHRGLFTSGDANNRDYVAGHVTDRVGGPLAAVAFDPQTSGGLLAAVAEDDVDRLREAAGFWVVGHVEAGAGVVLDA
jgi:selenide,water dikinase